MAINMVRDIHCNVSVTITHEQATDAIVDLEQTVPRPGIKDDRRLPVHGEIVNKGEEPQAKRDDGTKRSEEDQPNEPVVSSMEKPTTAMMADSVASDSTCPSVRTNGCDSASTSYETLTIPLDHRFRVTILVLMTTVYRSWFTRPQIYPTLLTQIRHI